jgi:formamidopyrimidine-DNA glycosylase
MASRVHQTPPVPEILEVELTRRAAGDLVGRRIVAIERTDPIVVGVGVDDVLPGATIDALDRRGKVLVARTDGPTIGLHFGMTGRLLRTGAPVAIERLAYGAGSDHARWDRWIAALDDGSRLRFHDPRRLGRVWLEPDLDRLGPDALAITRPQLAAALRGRRAPLKAVLLDQAAVAGLGNMLVDEVLWWAGLDPRRPAGSLAPDEVGLLQRTIRRRLPVMLRRGGSHTGALSPAVRAVAGPCRRDGAPLARTVVGGRTTVWCPVHQR